MAGHTSNNGFSKFKESLSRFIPSRWVPPFYRQRNQGGNEAGVVGVAGSDAGVVGGGAKGGKKRAQTMLTRRALGNEIIFNSEATLKFPPFPMRYREMGEMAVMEPVTRTCIETLRQEIFRRGMVWEPVFTSRCKRCKREFHGEVPMDRCPSCDPSPRDVYDILNDLYLKISEGDDSSFSLLQSVNDSDGKIPTHFFVYGQMKDPALLKSILGREPELKSATAEKFAISSIEGLPNLVKSKGNGFEEGSDGEGEELGSRGDEDEGAIEGVAKGMAFEFMPQEVLPFDRWAYQYKRITLIAKVNGVYTPCFAYSITTSPNHTLDLMEYPDPREYRDIDRFLRCCNNMGQSLREVLESCEDDINIFDDAYLVVRKEYELEGDGSIASGKARVVELIRGAPGLMRKIVDPYNRAGGLYRRCLKCDHLFSPGQGSHDTSVIDPSQVGVYEQLTRGNVPCPRCKSKVTYDCLYIETLTEGGEIIHGYIQGEIIHWQKYSPGPTFGYPPVLTLWPVIGALMYQNTYIRDYYMNRQTPKAIIGINTSNTSSFFRFWNKVVERLKEDRHYIPVIATESDGSGKSSISMLKLMDTLTEMEYTAAREEMRQRIGSFYGVSSTFLDDSGKDRGMVAADGIQTIVTARAVEKAHMIYNNKVLVELIEGCFGIKKWRLKLLPPEYRDVMKEEQTKQLKVQTAQMLFSMGFKISIDANGELIYWMPDVTDAQVGQIMELIRAKVQSQQQMAMAEMGLDGEGRPLIDPSKGESPDKEKREPKVNSKGTAKKGSDIAKTMGMGYFHGFEVGGKWNEGGQPLVDSGQLEKGVLVEKEHVESLEDPDDLEIATRIAKDHLAEIPDYYDRLLAMEAGYEAEKRVEGGEDTAKSEGGVQPEPKGGGGVRGRTKTSATQGYQSGSTFTPGGHQKTYVDPKTGKSYSSKEALGGATRSREAGKGDGGEGMNTQNRDEEIDLKIQELLLLMKMQQRPGDKMVIRMK